MLVFGRTFDYIDFGITGIRAGSTSKQKSLKVLYKWSWWFNCSHYISQWLLLWWSPV